MSKNREESTESFEKLEFTSDIVKDPKIQARLRYQRKKQNFNSIAKHHKEFSNKPRKRFNPDE